MEILYKEDGLKDYMTHQCKNHQLNKKILEKLKLLLNFKLKKLNMINKCLMKL